MPTYAPFFPVDELPVDGDQMGRTVTLRKNGTDVAYIWIRKDGVNQWVEMGERGPKGDTGAQGPAGTNGQNGISAYQVAVSQGYSGTITQWLASLIGATGNTGPQGPAGQSAILGTPTSIVTTSRTLVRGTDYHAVCDLTVTAISITLPASPTNGDQYLITKAKGTNQLKVLRNGNPIDGQNQDISVAANHTTTLRFAMGFGWISYTGAP